jgi:hypothetical protein
LLGIRPVSSLGGFLIKDYKVFVLRREPGQTEEDLNKLLDTGYLIMRMMPLDHQQFDGGGVLFVLYKQDGSYNGEIGDCG